jgi:hypothetical protein
MAAKIGQTVNALLFTRLEQAILSVCLNLLKFRNFFRSQVWGLARFCLRWLAWLGKRRAEVFLVPFLVFRPSDNPWGLAGCWRWRWRFHASVRWQAAAFATARCWRFPLWQTAACCYCSVPSVVLVWPRPTCSDLAFPLCHVGLHAIIPLRMPLCAGTAFGMLIGAREKSNYNCT